MVLALIVGGVGTLLATIFMLHTALEEIAEKSNQMEATRAEELLDASLRSARARISAMVTDNAVWDDAFYNAYDNALMETWGDTSYGPGSRDDKPYDGTYVIDETGKIVWATFRGKRYREPTIERLGGGLHTLLVEIKAQGLKGHAVSGLTRTEFGPAIVSIGLIAPSTFPMPATVKNRRYLIMTRHLSPHVVTDLGDAAGVQDLHLLGTGETSATPYALRGANGVTIGELSWSPRLTGEIATKAGRGRIEMTTLVVASLILMLVGLSALAIVRLARNETAAHRVARTDALSQLPNRRAFREKLSASAEQIDTCMVAVTFIDLDGFKDVNDVHGHEVGDKLICALAATFEAMVPPGAMLARMGGDEFAFLATGGNSVQMSRVFSEALFDFLSSPVTIDGHKLRVGASVGLATGNLKWVSPDEIVRRADVAMYHSKENGKGQLTRYDPKLDADRLKTQKVEDGLELGLERDEFEVLYQPIVDARTRAVEGVEALVRWPGRSDGQLFPDYFIPIAESSGAIHKLGRYVLQRACLEVATLPDVRLSVNVSPVQFQDAEFEEAVRAALESTGFPANRLEFELTETHLVDNPARTQAVIESLRSEGVTFALDDFGTGYSSIGQLRRFKFDRIKIDRSLVSVISHDNQANVLIAGTVNIARALSMGITAEGVESESHALLLKIAGCTSLQGYHFGKPMRIKDVHALLSPTLPDAARA